MFLHWSSSGFATSERRVEIQPCEVMNSRPKPCGLALSARLLHGSCKPARAQHPAKPRAQQKQKIISSLQLRNSGCVQLLRLTSVSIHHQSISIHVEFCAVGAPEITRSNVYQCQSSVKRPNAETQAGNLSPAP